MVGTPLQSNSSISSPALFDSHIDILSNTVDMSEEMKIDPARAQALISQIGLVKDRIAAVANGRNIRLVAVSKLKPINDILALHQDPVAQTHFGENYTQELTQKAELLPRTIQWHFIGGLQSGHCKTLAKIPNLFSVSSVDTSKKAQLLNTARTNLISSDSSISKLGIHVQVNTSGEEAKSGCAPGSETVALCREIIETCPSLELLGLMTIGAIARSKATTAETENEDFLTLRDQRQLVAKELGLDEGKLELSMGMSEDFEGAISLGSSEVRVGSTIFGERPAKADAKIKV
uniref:Pyridoxal phosphate homeostasis protein n=2 Tax=Bionectria ochroleuca TaxID=29856 RepID=A0A0B7JT35_BIOOC